MQHTSLETIGYSDGYVHGAAIRPDAEAGAVRRGPEVARTQLQAMITTMKTAALPLAIELFRHHPI